VTSLSFGKSVAGDDITLILDWYIYPSHAPLIVAEQQGYFAEKGLKVKLIAPSDPSDGPKLVAANEADMALTYQPQLLMQIDQGLPLVRLGSLVDTPLNCLVTLRNQKILDIKDLKGKVIGYSSGGIDNAMLATMLANHDVKLSDVKFVNVGYDLVQALISGNIQAFTGGMRNVEPILLNLSGYPSQVFYPEKNGFPSYEELIFVVNRDHVEDQRWSKFFLALRQGVEYLTAHPEESWQKAIKQYPELNNPSNKASWLASIQYFSKNPAALDKEKYQTFAEFMESQKLIKKAPDLSSYTALVH